jgi:energy-coupling factor transporter ATP-binding protein EcfA2
MVVATNHIANIIKPLADSAEASARKNDFTSNCLRTTGMLAPAARIGHSAAVASRSTGYLMINSLEIQNFRGFAHTSVSDLRRINIIVGDNGAGKTAFLEAIFLAGANTPEAAVKTRAWRGAPGGAIVGMMQAYRAFWGDLFNDFDLAKVVQISLHDTSGGRSRELKIFTSAAPQLLPLEPDKASAPPQSRPITFEWSTPDGVQVSSTPTLQPQGIAITPPSVDTNIDIAFFGARALIAGQENAQYFSELSVENKEGDFIDAMKKQFAEIENISIEATMGTPSLFVKFKWGDRKMPIYFLSDGMTKIAAILLSIAHRPQGAVLIDELEAGLYFKRQGRLWEHIRKFATAYQTQVFTTTHSLECLRSAIPIVKKHIEDFAVVRVQRKRSQSLVDVVSGKKALDLLQSGLEIRV